MTTDLPPILSDHRILWQGVDDTTPDGCTLITAEVLGLVTTYVLRDGAVLGRIEASRTYQHGYAGSGLKGGYYLGSADSLELGRRIVERADREETGKS